MNERKENEKTVGSFFELISNVQPIIQLNILFVSSEITNVSMGVLHDGVQVHLIIYYDNNKLNNFKDISLFIFSSLILIQLVKIYLNYEQAKNNNTTFMYKI